MKRVDYDTIRKTMDEVLLKSIQALVVELESSVTKFGELKYAEQLKKLLVDLFEEIKVPSTAYSSVNELNLIFSRMVVDADSETQMIV